MPRNRTEGSGRTDTARGQSCAGGGAKQDADPAVLQQVCGVGIRRSFAPNRQLRQRQGHLRRRGDDAEQRRDSGVRLSVFQVDSYRWHQLCKSVFRSSQIPPLCYYIIYIIRG